MSEGPSLPRSRWNAGRTPEVGGRVMVRRHLRDGETSHLLTDVIGTVVALAPAFVVRRESGEEVTIPAEDIAVLKVLPPRPVRNRDIRDLEFAAALAWPGTEYEVVDGWLCRAGDDWSYRRGAAVPVLPWADAAELDGVRDWYAARGLPLRLEAVDRLVDLERARLGGEPVGAGQITAGRDLLLCTADAAALAAAGHPARGRLTLDPAPAGDWVGLYHGTAGLEPDRVRPALTATAALSGGDPVPGGDVTFARVEIDGDLAAIARGALTAGPDGERRVGISCVETEPGHRRLGLAEAVSSALAAWGVERGATSCHLHVFADNAAGQALWGKLGFVAHHRLRHVLVTPPAGDPA